MAISKTIEATAPGVSQQLIVENAYFRIEKLSGNKKGMTAELSGYENENATQPFAFFSINFVPSLDGSNFIAQAYQQFKTLDEFADATDC